MNTSDTQTPRSLAALLRDAQLLLDAKTEQALSEAGSTRRELRLLSRLASGKISPAFDHHVAHSGSLASLFATRGWIEYAAGSWRLTATGTSEYDRLTQVTTDVTVSATGTDSTLIADLGALVEGLGGVEAARSARHERRSAHRDHRAHRQHGERGQCGHGHGHGDSHGEPSHARRGGHGQRDQHRTHGACADGDSSRPFGRTHRGHRSGMGQHDSSAGGHDHTARGHNPRGAHPHSADRHEHGRNTTPHPGQSRRPAVATEDLERVIRDLGRGLAPLLPFLRSEGFGQRGGHFGPRGGDATNQG